MTSREAMLNSSEHNLDFKRTRNSSVINTFFSVWKGNWYFLRMKEMVSLHVVDCFTLSFIQQPFSEEILSPSLSPRPKPHLVTYKKGQVRFRLRNRPTNV